MKLQLCKVHISWEGHKIVRNLPLTFDWLVHTVKSKGKISQNFVAFSEYMNFTDPNLNVHAGLVYNNFGLFCDGQRLCYRRTTTFQVFTLFCSLFLTTIHIWLMDKVNLIESLSYHLLTNLTTTTIAARSQSPLKECLNLWCL